jgi:PEGA domain
MRLPASSCSRPIRFVFLAISGLVCLALTPQCAAKDYLTITSQPPGATVELDGVVVGKTPYSVEIPEGIFMVRKRFTESYSAIKST